MNSKDYRNYAPVTFWSLNSKLNKEEAARQLKEFANAGFGGVFLHSRVGLITSYMSEDWLDFIEFCVDKGNDLGLNMYLYDEDMWPSGYGEGKISKEDDSFREKTLVLVDESEIVEGDEVVCDFKGKKIAIRATENGYVRFNGGCFTDEMNPFAVKAFISSVHDVYFKKMSDRFGSKIKGIFTDEPCYNLSSFHAEPHAPFSPFVVQRLKDEFGLDFKENAYKLFSDNEKDAPFKIAYFKSASRQFVSAYTAQYAKWCEDHNVVMTGHMMEEDSLKGQIRFTGGVIPHYFAMQQPGVDKLFRGIGSPITLKQLTSACEWQNKRSLCECFAGMGQEATFFERKKIVDWQAIHGINFVNPHLSLYSMQGERKRDYPANIGYQQPYFGCMKAENDYVTRLSEIIAKTKSEVKLALLQPLSTAFAEYNPTKPDDDIPSDEIYAFVAKTLSSRRVDYHILSEEMLESCRVTGGKLVGGGYEYDLLILPGVKYVGEKAASIIKEFNHSSVAVAENAYNAEICCENEEDFRDFAERNIAPCVEIRGADETILARKMRGDCAEYIFVCNTDEKEKVIFPDIRNVTIFCVSDGREYFCPDNPKLTLMPHGSVCFIVGKKSFSLPKRQIFADGFVLGKPNLVSHTPKWLGSTEENVLPIDEVVFESDGKKTDKLKVNHIWHYIFYKLADGTPFKASYSFVCKKLPEGEVNLLIENAENLEKIEVNGIEMKADREFNSPQTLGKGCKKDISLATINVTGIIKPGENAVVLHGKKFNNVNDVCCHRHVEDSKNYASTEVDIIYVSGDFGVEIENNVPVIAEKREKGLFAAENSLPFYSGGLRYHVSAKVRKGDEIVLSGAFAAAKVSFADGSEKIVSNAFPVILSECDSDDLTVIVYNTLFNMSGPHHVKDYESRLWIDPGIFNDTVNVTEEYKLFPFGLKEVSINRR